ncbi:molybdopterin-guanine dinucleotide biosynthesis protein B [Azospirillum doebereinerae]|uniref:Molybdopterin-guanine dinucleotide biosynthesis protein B n=1 Tax=Azospirillum doebereinerae TaxID=92933 RepID=A0A433JAP1_9PROT|nr:molybdopterin-guanine dinucleotide biosynthesis protein B [Azospirillum doebereinerae]MCG5242116.1 molybdopterin-guanine dinucleotide biosynthesis protein B [Azospirillum doebereinerae]RUQ72938.1 molybdopterin-guanine dinucleotide biosynthesis protein B [Azospirillum doebereinerae]
MEIFGLTGWSGSGKTALMVRLLPALTRRGLRVSTVKHAHKGFDIDHPGKDSHDHRLAGATEVLVSSPYRWALMHELRDEPEPALADLLPKLAPVDLLLIEGFKRDAHAKIEVWRSAVGKPLIARDDPSIVAVASDGAVPGCPVPVLDLNDAEAVAAFVVERCGLEGASAR